MTKRHDQHRPHCVDLAPGAFKSTGPATGTRTGRTSRKAAHGNLQTGGPFRLHRSAGRQSAGKAPHGAVRITATGQRPARHGHTGKLYLALAGVAAGIFWTTTATPTATPAGSPVDPITEVKPVPATVRASMNTPAFFFDDAADALAAHFSRQADTTRSTDASQASGSEHSDDVSATMLAMIQPRSRQSTGTAVLAPDFDSNETAALFEPDARRNDSSEQADGSGSATQVISPLAENPALDAVRRKAMAPQDAIKTVVLVQPGNTLSGILNDHGVKIDQMPRLLQDDIIDKHLSRLEIGQQLDIYQLPGGDFHSLEARVDDDRRITIRRADDDFAVASIDLPIEKERVVTSGTIEQSLYLAAEQANLKQSTIMELADIFQWELDFARDIRKGDQFSIVYDRLYRDNSYIGDGDILAAEFVRGGKTYRAIRFTTDDGHTAYYSPDGQPKRRTFMRHPVDVVRITSKFDPNRLHPVLHKLRAHRGVDYGAPHGAPIYATADGTIQFSGIKGSYGNTVIIKHGKKFSTLYAHMSRISDKSVTNKRVKQGDVIGYVGKTGRVTGTHLHYEFRVNGEQIDPLKVELPAASPIEKQYLPELQRISNEMIAQMRSVLPDQSDDQQVAAFDSRAMATSASDSNPEQ